MQRTCFYLFFILSVLMFPLNASALDVQIGSEPDEAEPEQPQEREAEPEQEGGDEQAPGDAGDLREGGYGDGSDMSDDEVDAMTEDARERLNDMMDDARDEMDSSIPGR